MQHSLKFYNTLSKKKEIFEPINSPFVGMYVCGPTVYGDAHMGHARAYVTFDVLFRYLQYLGYKVRYVRNITDVGHLSDEVAGEGEDRIAKKAKLQQLEPMEVVQHYADNFHMDMDSLNLLHPSIEPHASGHIPEQIAMIETIMQNGLAYEVNGSVYFDVLKYNEGKKYGILSGRVVEEMMSGSRDNLNSQEEKRNPLDFALWKKASPEHIMRWKSPWSDGFPGWHLECSAMSAKYLGNYFDIHGGGMDLMFPHHECEIAQSQACNHTDPVKYWLHNNMVTINGQKMGRSLNNFINLNEVFTGNNPLLDQAYSPMTLRFFILQAHYRSTLDFSNEALKSAQKGYKRLINGLRIVKKLQYKADDSVVLDSKAQEEIQKLCRGCFEGINDDLNTAVSIANLFNLLKKINSIYTGALSTATLGEEIFTELKNTFVFFIEEILGLKEEKSDNAANLTEAMLELYGEAKQNKEYDRVDKIRSYFKANGLVIKDMKTGVDWAYEE